MDYLLQENKIMNIAEVSPFIDTILSQKAKPLYITPFMVEVLGNSMGGEEPMKNKGFLESDDAYYKRLTEWDAKEKLIIFNGWSCIDMGVYQKFTRSYDSTTIEFTYTDYTITTYGRKIKFPTLPDTVDDFINDCKRVGVKLFWAIPVIEKYGYENITSDKKIVEYYKIIDEFNKDNMK